jgi:hypothetical protein
VIIFDGIDHLNNAWNVKLSKAMTLEFKELHLLPETQRWKAKAGKSLEHMQEETSGCGCICNRICTLSLETLLLPVMIF